MEVKRREAGDYLESGEAAPRHEWRGVHLEVQNISKVFDSRGVRNLALEDVNLEVERGQFVSLVGPSGCGKTTLLRIIAGLTMQSQGEVLLEGKRLQGVSPDMGFVFQNVSLLPWRSVIRNVELGLDPRSVKKAERRERALSALELVGLAGVADSAPYHLSGGMEQRVGVARALAINPQILLMDEPFGQLDNFLREQLQVDIAKLLTGLGTTVIFVTHDVDEAIFLSDKIVLFQRNPGRIIGIEEVDIPKPRWEFNVRGDPRAIAMRERILSSLGVRDGG